VEHGCDVRDPSSRNFGSNRAERCEEVEFTNDRAGYVGVDTLLDVRMQRGYTHDERVEHRVVADPRSCRQRVTESSDERSAALGIDVEIEVPQVAEVLHVAFSSGTEHGEYAHRVPRPETSEGPIDGEPVTTAHCGERLEHLVNLETRDREHHGPLRRLAAVFFYFTENAHATDRPRRWHSCTPSVRAATLSDRRCRIRSDGSDRACGVPGGFRTVWSMSTRPAFRYVALSWLAVVLLAPAIPARADESTPPSDTSSGLNLTDAEIEALTLPPMPAGFPTGPRLFVRTNAVNSTEYLYIRKQISDAGFPDVLEVSPGSLVVAIGATPIDDATQRLGALRGVVEVAPAPAFNATTPVSFPTMPSLLAATAGLALVLTGIRLRRRDDSDPAAV
jgi:hypothetical protein